MFRSGMWALAITATVAVIVSVASIMITSSAYAGKQPGMDSYVLSSGEQVWSRYGLAPNLGGGQPGADATRVQPLLLRLAREGHVQNVRMSWDGRTTLLADNFAAQLLHADGSLLSPNNGPKVVSQPAAGAVSGRVTATGGAAIAGATVSAFLDSNVVTATTTITGSYTLNLPGTGDYQVGVYAAGYEWQPGVLVALPTGASNVNFTLVPQSFTISGTIRSDATGSPPLANVEVWASDLVYDNFTKGNSTTTDANGNYTLTVSTSTYEVRAFNPPLGARSRTVTVGPSATGIDLTFSLQTMYTVSGVVRKGNGQPLPGGEVTFPGRQIPTIAVMRPTREL